MNFPLTIQAFVTIFQRDLTLANRTRADVLNPVFFFVLVSVLFSLGLSPTKTLLQTIGPGVIWVCALLATLLSLERLFRSDFDDGSLDQLLLAPHPTSLLISAKMLAHWLTSSLPLILCAPFIGMMFGLPSPTLLTLTLTLAIGTPILSLVGSIGMALTVGLPRGGVLLSLIVLPLYIPVLVFGARAVELSTHGLSATAPLYWLSAMLVMALTLSPLTTAEALRISLR